MIFDSILIASWTHPRKLPEPPSIPGYDERLPLQTAVSLHFIDGGEALIVSYSHHGIMYEGVTSSLSCL